MIQLSQILLCNSSINPPPHTGYPPQFQSAIVRLAGVGQDEWVVAVKWSKVIISSCSDTGYVPQYVLCVTTPASDGQSAATDCVHEFVTSETQYNLTLTSNIEYRLTVTVITCANLRLRGNPEIIVLKFSSSHISCVYMTVISVQMRQKTIRLFLSIVNVQEYWSKFRSLMGNFI